MGIISEALERQKLEKGVKARDPHSGLPDKPLPDGDVPGTTPFESACAYDHRLVVISEPNCLEAERFKMLRAQILFPKDGKVPKTILVTSSYPGEGKTYVAANLAASIALGISEHVLLIDCDLRNPSAHKLLRYSNREGLHEYLMGEKQLPDLIIRSGIDKLSLLCAGGSSSKSSELLASAKMKQFLSEVRDRYHDRFVIMDSTPTQLTSESNVLANFVDGIVFVVLAEKAPRAVVRKSIEQFSREKTIGVVFNGYDDHAQPYLKFYKSAA